MRSADPTLSVAERVDAACDRFEAEWKAGSQPRIDDYLTASPESDHVDLRQALHALELELQGRSETDTSISQSSVRADGQAVPDATIQHVGGIVPSRAAVGRFEIRGVLGSGAFGKVYRAFDPQLGREVAVKVPLESTVKTEKERAQFLKEARSAATINHPNVCQVHEVGEADGRPYIVMALVRGQSLADTLKTRKEPLPEKQAALVVRKIALALAAAHDSGIVHRDLKPANVMFDRERKDIVVMDFGLARGPRLGDARGTQSGVIMGTPAYMSPEQARGDSKGVGPAGDIFSLGIILYELLAGARPFTGTATEVIGKILHVEPEKPSAVRPGVDPRLEAACLKAMAKDPTARFATMKEFAAVVDAVLRAPAPAGPAADTARAGTTRQEGDDQSTSTSNNLAEVFAALSDDRKQARAETAAVVEAAIAKHRTPRWMFLLVGLLFAGGLTVLASVVFFTRSDKVKVDLAVIINDVDLKDKSLSFFLDEEPITADALAKPVELKSGVHIFTVKRGKDIVKRVEIRVEEGKNPGIKVEDITPKEPLPKAPDTKDSPRDGDRTAAEWVLSVSGSVRVNDTNADIKAAKDLPKEPFRLTGVNLYGNQRVTDDDLSVFKGCKDVTSLTLSSPKVTDAGLAHFTNCKGMKDLFLWSVPVTDAGLAHFKDCKGLKQLVLWNVPVTDAGLAHFEGCKGLGHLVLAGSEVTDAGMVYFKDCKALLTINLADTQVGNTGLAHFTGCKDLYDAFLGGTRVSDAGLVVLKSSKVLRTVNLAGTKVTDAGLVHLKDCAAFTTLNVKNTQVTATGIGELKKVLPGCRIIWDGGTIEPKKSPELKPSPPPEEQPHNAEPVIEPLLELPQNNYSNAPWLSPDGLTIYFQSAPLGTGGARQLWQAERKNPGAKFENLHKLFVGHDPAVASDGLEIIFGNKFTHWSAVRNSTKEDFGQPREIQEFVDLGFGQKTEKGRLVSFCLSEDGLFLWADQLKDGRLLGTVRLKRTSRSTPWSNPVTVNAPAASRLFFISPKDGLGFCAMNLPDGGDNTLVVMSTNDGGLTFANPKPIEVGNKIVRGKSPRYVSKTKELFFAENDRKEGGPTTFYVIRNFEPKIERKVAIDGKLPVVEPLLELPQNGYSSHPWLSSDGLTLYFQFVPKGDKGRQLWQADRKHPGAKFENLRKLFPGEDVTVTTDGLEMIFVNKFTLWSAVRSSTKDDFGPPQEIQEMIGFGYGPGAKLGRLGSPSFSDDGLFIWADRIQNGKVTETLRFRRKSRDAAWSDRVVVKAPANSRQFFVSPKKGWGFCTMTVPGESGPEALVALSTDDEGLAFSNPKSISVRNEVVRGRSPRYAPQTRELFFAEHLQPDATSKLYVIRHFDPK